MKTSGTTSPRTRSPVPFHNESTGTLRRTGTSLERDGNERRQMRRSERREAELRRENEMLALKAKEKPNNQPNEVSQNTEIQSAEGPTTESAPHQTPERHVPRVAPRVIPREKDKPPEPAFRRRRNENKGINELLYRIDDFRKRQLTQIGITLPNYIHVLPSRVDKGGQEGSPPTPSPQ